MGIWFVHFKRAFLWRCRLNGMELLRFVGLSILAYALLVGLMMVSLQMVAFTPLVERLTAAGVMAFTATAVKIFLALIFLPVGLHCLRSTIRLFTAR